MKLPFTIGNRPIQGNFDALTTELVARIEALEADLASVTSHLNNRGLEFWGPFSPGFVGLVAGGVATVDCTHNLGSTAVDGVCDLGSGLTGCTIAFSNPSANVLRVHCRNTTGAAVTGNVNVYVVRRPTL